MYGNRTNHLIAVNNTHLITLKPVLLTFKMFFLLLKYTAIFNTLNLTAVIIAKMINVYRVYTKPCNHSNTDNKSNDWYCTIINLNLWATMTHKHP